MRRYTALFLFILVCAGRSASAQITITRADVAAQLGQRTETVTYEGENTTGLQAVVDARGSGQTWDLRAVRFSPVFASIVEPASGTTPGSGDPHFDQANYVQKMTVNQEAEIDSVFYSYNRLTGDAYQMLGTAGMADFDGDGVDELVALKFKPSSIVMKLPMSMGTTWAGTTTIEFSFGLPFTTTLEETHEVEGAGVLLTTLPSGGARSDEALKVRTRSISITSFPGFPETRDTSYTVTFMTKTGLGAAIGLDEAGAPQDVSLSVSGAAPVANEPDVDVPGAITLAPGFPNPFNPQATIPFTLAEAGHVRLEVFDALGRHVATLVDGIRAAGDHAVAWAAGDLPSGTYLARLTAGSQVRTQVLTLQK
jgi:hypothetical protein